MSEKRDQFTKEFRNDLDSLDASVVQPDYRALIRKVTKTKGWHQDNLDHTKYWAIRGRGGFCAVIYATEVIEGVSKKVVLIKYRGTPHEQIIYKGRPENEQESNAQTSH